MSRRSLVPLFCVAAAGLTVLGAWYAFPPPTSPPPRSPGEAPTDVSLRGPGPAPQEDALEHRFSGQVRPFLERYCFGCHGPTTQEAGLDLSRDSTMSAVANNARRWGMVLERLQAGE